MFDASLRRLIDPPLDLAGRVLARAGVTANAMTGLGLGFGLGAACAIVAGWFGWALCLLLAGRLADGLDGAIARATQRTDLGGFLDIVADFVFYGAIPLAFALHDPAAHALAAAVLLFSFYVNGASFLAFSALAAKRGLETSAQGLKSIFYSAGLAEGGETIAVFVLMVLVPGWFAGIAVIFAALVAITALLRLRLAWTTFGP